MPMTVTSKKYTKSMRRPWSRLQVELLEAKAARDQEHTEGAISMWRLWSWLPKWLVA